MAVNVFLFFPRGTGANLLGPLQFKPSRALTGFSETVTFQQVARGLDEVGVVVNDEEAQRRDLPVRASVSGSSHHDRSGPPWDT